MKPLIRSVIEELFVVLIITGVVIIGIVFIIYLATPSPKNQAAMRVPQLLSEIDGCRVYSFVDNGTHYFTRCGTQVETVKNYTENCGKACSRHRIESITTEGNE